MEINNAFYEHLGDRWYQAEDDPVALLRAESKWRNPWVLETIQKELGHGPRAILDVGCGAGFLANELAIVGHTVTGIDESPESIRVAERRLKGRGNHRVNYRVANAYHLPMESNTFDAVCVMDFLEHVEDPAQVLHEAQRVTKPGGLLFFHTFNRTLLSWLVAIKGVEWFVKNTPERMHLHRLFIRPEELKRMLERFHYETQDLFGSRPVLNRAFFKLLLTGTVSPDFAFTRCSSLALGYTGYARKERK